ncbi:ABC transporter permease [Clostridium sp. CF011]|uniref:ABC transporter permease n=1 Tax=Clostridium sp. CF011 TaxID=2843318 RepID=UPI001C0E3785|nr:ABC transporter permease [Clostridium sp. CF011]MBU3091037.1 ABC transporter permease [Clostridium sp. CF011]WAG69044.1 ABC transporter permease [Clostridium sp. CF011]
MEFSIRRVNALFKKEIKDLSKNMNVLLMCMMPIILSVIYSKLFGGSTSGAHMQEAYILSMCLNMNLTLVSSFVIAMLIAEEKEKNTLRTLMLSAVSPLEFLAGKAIITLLVSVIINISIFFIIGIDAQYLGRYILLTTLVVFSMIEIGAVIGIIAPNQMATGVIGMPVLMILLMVPIFAKFNKTLARIAEILPNYNMDIMLEKVFKGQIIGTESAYGIFVILAWIVIAAGGFVYIYSKRGLDK